MDVPVPLWVRLGLAVVLAPPLLVTGLWAVLAPNSWYEHFPGLGPQLVAADPPFNAHLATDAGGGFLAIGLALVAAALWARRSAVCIALLTYLVFTLPHLIYHAANPAPGLSTTAQVMNVVLLASGAATGAVLAWGARPKPTNRDAPTARTAHAATATTQDPRRLTAT